MRQLPKFPVGGGCQCGAVRYEVLSVPLGVYACHCRDCQRFSGTTHTLSMVLKASDFRHLSGELTHLDKKADSGRVVRMLACAKCGNKLWNEPQSSPDLIILKPGSLDDMDWVEPIGNIWTSSAPAWVAIDPNGPNFERQPPSREPLFAAWAAAHAEGT